MILILQLYTEAVTLFRIEWVCGLVSFEQQFSTAPHETAIASYFDGLKYLTRSIHRNGILYNVRSMI